MKSFSQLISKPATAARQLKCRLPADEALFHQFHHVEALDQLFGQPLVANQPSFPRLALASKERDRA